MEEQLFMGKFNNKRALSILLATVTSLSIVGCSGGENENNPEGTIPSLTLEK